MRLNWMCNENKMIDFKILAGCEPSVSVQASSLKYIENLFSEAFVCWLNSYNCLNCFCHFLLGLHDVFF